MGILCIKQEPSIKRLCSNDKIQQNLRAATVGIQEKWSSVACHVAGSAVMAFRHVGPTAKVNLYPAIMNKI